MIVDSVAIEVRMSRPTPTPRVPTRPMRNAFWIFMTGGALLARGLLRLGCHLLGRGQHTAKAFEVTRDSVALDPNLREPVLGVGDECACALLGIGDELARLLVRRGDAIARLVVGLVADDGDLGANLGLEAVGLGAAPGR